MLGLGGIAAYVFFYLPQRVEAPVQVRTVDSAIEDRARKESAPDIEAPFEAAELARARKQAKDQLAEFVELELGLVERMNVGVWGAAELAQVKGRASAADQMFDERRYQEALDEYAAATEDLVALEAKGDALFQADVAEGQVALEKLDHPHAVAAFERALAVRPQHPGATAGAERASKLPKVIELLRESDRAALRGDYGAAEEYLGRVRALDPDTTGLAERTVEIAATRASERRKATLSEGFKALGRSEHDRALAAFNRVLEGDPNDADALAGVQQAKQARLLARIDALRDAAGRQEREDRWTDALATYDAALGLDPTLRFARDGKARIGARLALLEAMTRFVDDPGLLSAADEFSAAKEVLAQAGAETAAGARFETQVVALRAIVQRSSVPVPLVIVSDNATEVVIHKVGVIGTFARRELMLRPGRYVIVGSQNGCRDVREEIILAPDTAPVDIRCVERI